MRGISFIIGISSLIVHVEYSSAKVASGHLITHENWAFLDRFCFLSIDGSFEYWIEFEYDPERSGNVSLLMYPDSQWPEAYKNPLANTCEKRMGALIPDKNQIVWLLEGVKESGCEKVHKPRFPSPLDDNGTQSYRPVIICKNFRKFRSARERWWFIAISSCNSSKGLDLKFKFYMKNGQKGDYWYEHFSADEFYILPILTAFCFIYLFLLFCALIFAVELKCRQLLHTTYKLFLLSMSLQTVGIMLLCISYGNYASNGVGLPEVKLSGRVCESGSEFVFVLLLLLLAKGYTVTRGRLRPASAVKLTVFNCAYVLLYVMLFLFEQYTFDPGLVVYMYESEAGYGILFLRLVGYLMFVYGIFFTLKHYPEKSSFYIPFFGIYSLWFISGPIVILISNYVIDKWVREKVAVSIMHSIAFVGHVIFLGLTRPSAANKSFPYHVRTTQVGMMDDKNNQTVDNFEAHTYAPSYTDGNGRTVDIFTVSGVAQRSPGEPNLDVFNANGGITPGLPPQLPAVFPVPPPKYHDAFPHQKPGQIEEMLREPEEDEDDEENSSGRDPGVEDSDAEAPQRNNNNTGGDQSPPYLARRRSPLPPLPPLNNNRERKYMCDNNEPDPLTSLQPPSYQF